MRLEILPILGIGEVEAGDDLAGILAAATPGLRDGDVVVVTSKVVSKAEGRVVTGDRQAAIDAESVRVVARRGDTRIVQTRHGFVMAAAGVDASNVEKGSLVLLPLDPDASARHLREGLRAACGADVAVVVSDTFGRPWREGVTDMAIGVAGIAALLDLRGDVDAYGNELGVTVTAVADELAAAADLVKGKLDGVPAAIVRGYQALADDGRGARALVRLPAADMFRYGSRDVVLARRDATGFGLGNVDADALARATAAAASAPWTGSGPVPWRFDVVEPHERAAISPAHADGTGGALLASAPVVVALWLADSSPRALLAAGAATGNLLVALTAEGLESRYIPVLSGLDPGAALPVLAALVAIGPPAE